MALVASTVGLVLSPASAVTSNVGYTLSAADPTLSTPLGDGSVTSCTAGSGPGTYPYRVARVKISVADVYAVTDTGPGDGRLGIYDGPFDPAAPQTNCVQFVDTNDGIALQAKTYTVVMSTATTLGYGAYSYSFDGPGAATVLAATTTTLTTNPNPSELSKATTLKAVVAGGATPTGSVVFRDGAKVLGSAALAGGVAQLNVKSLAVGSHTLSATYSGDGTHDVSADTAVHKVKYGPKPKLKLSISAKTVAVGKKVKLTWVSKNADKVKASGDWKGKKPKKGAVRVKIKSLGVHIFKLKASNVNGVDRAKVKVVAVRAPKDFTVTVPDDVLTAGTKVRVRAVKLDPKERFKVFLDDELLGKGFADKRGLASALVTLPKTLTEGEHTLTVMGSNADRSGTLDVFVIAGAKELTVKVAKEEVKIGKQQTVTVSGLAEGESVTLTYDGADLVVGTADEDGEFKHTFPVGSSTGVRTIEAVGQLPGRNGQDTFVVLS